MERPQRALRGQCLNASTCIGKATFQQTVAMEAQVPAEALRPILLPPEPFRCEQPAQLGSFRDAALAHQDRDPVGELVRPVVPDGFSVVVGERRFNGDRSRLSAAVHDENAQCGVDWMCR